MRKKRINTDESLLSLINRIETLLLDSFTSVNNLRSFQQELIQLREGNHQIINLPIIITSLLKSETISQSESNFSILQNLIEEIISLNLFNNDSEEKWIDLFESLLTLFDFNKSNNTLKINDFIIKIRKKFPLSESLKLVEAKILFNLINLVGNNNMAYSKLLLEQFTKLGESNTDNLEINIAYARAIVNSLVFNKSANDVWSVFLLAELQKLQNNKIESREFVILLGEGYSNFIINTNDLERSFEYLNKLAHHYRNNQFEFGLETEYLKSIGGILFRFSEQLNNNQLSFCLEEYIYLAQKNNTNIAVLEMTISLFCKILSTESQIILLPNYLLNIIEIHLNQSEIERVKHYLQIFNSIFKLNEENGTFALAYILAESLAFRFYIKKKMSLEAQSAFNTIEYISSKFITHREIQMIAADLRMN